MKNPDRNSISQLDELHKSLCAVLRKRIDPCVIDVFLSAIYFMEGGESLSWWLFTDERKKYLTGMEN
ncbi:MAG: helix-hairpin-helix domain-containing protein [Methylococcaceae bacterium]